MATRTTSIELKELDEITIHVLLESLPPGLLTNAIPAHSKNAMIIKTEGGKPPDEPKRSLKEQFEDALYPVTDAQAGAEYGIPATAFKMAMSTAAARFKKLGAQNSKKLDGTQIKSLISVCASADDLIPIVGVPEMRHDLISNSQGSKSATTRAWFREWTADVPITFPEALIHPQQVAQLMLEAGMGIGVGAWRRERGGHFGRWRVVDVVGG